MRLERLQQALAAQLKKPIASVFLPFEPDYTKMDYEAVREQEIDKLVDAGEIGENQRNRVLCFRWMTRSRERGPCEGWTGWPGA